VAVSSSIDDYQLPWLGNRHIESTRYHEFVAKLREANPENLVDEDIVEACFWKAINVQICDTRARGYGAEAMIAEGRTVLAQARKYWAEDAENNRTYKK